MYFLWCIIVGIFVGWMTGKFMKGYGYGGWMDILMGIGGGLAGGFILRSASLSGWGAILYATLVATLGAIILTVFTAFASGKRRYA